MNGSTRLQLIRLGGRVRYHQTVGIASCPDDLNGEVPSDFRYSLISTDLNGEVPSEYKYSLMSKGQERLGTIRL